MGQMKIVPLGNSITQGNIAWPGANSYRRNLWHKLIDAGYHVDFVGSLDTDNKGRTFPDPTFDHDHEGHWGWRADEILADLPVWLAGYTPDVALIHLGSNDAIQGNSVASTLQEIEDIIGILRNDNAGITIFLAQILPVEDAVWNANVNGINAGLATLASNLDQAQSRIILVDQNSGWNIANFTYDGVHPNLDGEERMAQRWFTAFDAFYSSVNEAPEITGQQTLSVDEDLSLTLSVSDFTISDPDSEPGDMSLLVSGGSNYAVNGTTISPDENWHGTLSVQVAVSDGESESEPYNAQVTVNPVNDPPVITGQSEISVLEDHTLELTVSHFTVNDVDHPSGPFTLAVLAGSNYSQEGNRITPSVNYAGILSVPVIVSDGSAVSHPFNAIVTVTGVNDAPLVTDIPDQTIQHGEQFEVIHLGMYVEDDETSDSQISWSVMGASHLSVTIANQVAVISPQDANWTGSETLIFVARDDDPAEPLSASDEVQFTIHPAVSLENAETGSMSLYPNPSNGEFIIDTDGKPTDLTLVIYDSQGRLIKHQTYKHVSRLRENLSDYTNGVYLIQILTGEHIWHLKYLKQ
jgi:hypothetical protein